MLTFTAALQKDYADTPYAALSALRSAEFLQTQGKHDAALAALTRPGLTIADPAVAALVELRAVRLLLAAGKPEEAIKRLDSLKSASFPAVADELRGDAEAALGHRDAARKAYESALSHLDVAAPTRPLLELKLTDAGGRLPDQPEI